MKINAAQEVAYNVSILFYVVCCVLIAPHTVTLNDTKKDVLSDGQDAETGTR